MNRPEFDPSYSCVRRAWRAHAGELRGYLAHRLAEREAAEDLVQEVFLRAMRQRQGFCQLDNPRAWLFQVARNALADRLRLGRPEIALPDDLADAVEECAPVDALADCLDTVLAALPAEDAEILRRCDIDGMKQRDFAADRGLSLTAAKSRLLRARLRLREQLVTLCGVRFDAAGRVCCCRPGAD